MSNETKNIDKPITVEVMTSNIVPDDTATIESVPSSVRSNPNAKKPLDKTFLKPKDLEDSGKMPTLNHKDPKLKGNKMSEFLNGETKAPSDRELRRLERAFRIARDEAMSGYYHGCRIPNRTVGDLFIEAKEAGDTLMNALKRALHFIIIEAGEDSEDYKYIYSDCMGLRNEVAQLEHLHDSFTEALEEERKDAEVLNANLMSDLMSTSLKNVSSNHSKKSHSKVSSRISKSSSYIIKKEQEVLDRERKLQDKMDKLKLDEEKRRIEETMEKAKRDLEEKRVRAQIEKEHQRIQEDKDRLNDLDLKSNSTSSSYRSISSRRVKLPHQVKVKEEGDVSRTYGLYPKFTKSETFKTINPKYSSHAIDNRGYNTFNKFSDRAGFIGHPNPVEDQPITRMFHDSYSVSRYIDSIEEKFDGNYKQWQNFILDVERMSVRFGTDAVGMEYMMDCLVKMCSGDPLDIVLSSRRRYPRAKDAFDDAMKKLTDMYGKVRLIMRKRIEDVTRKERAKWESQSLQKLYLELDNCLVINDNRIWEEELNGPIVIEKIIRNRLPTESARKLTNMLVREDRELPKFNELVNFVRCEFHRASHRLNEPWLEESDTGEKQVHPSSKHDRQRHKGLRVNNVVSSSAPDGVKSSGDIRPERKCAVCNEPDKHSLSKCKAFKALDLTGRWDVVKKQRLCIACLGWGHGYKDCPSQRCCYHCRDKKHNSLLCKDGEKKSGAAAGSGNVALANVTTYGEETSEEGTAIIGNCVFSSMNCRRFLPVIPVILTHRKSGKKRKINVLLDTGCDTSCLEMKIAKEIGVDGPAHKLTLNTVNGVTQRDCIIDDFEIKGINMHNKFLLDRVSCVSELNVTHSNPLKKQLCMNRYPHLRGIQLPVLENCMIDMIIGVDHEELLDLTDSRRGPKGTPVAKLSPFGYLIVGREENCNVAHAQINNMRLFSNDCSNNLEPLMAESVCSGELESCRRLHEEIERYFYCDYTEYFDDDEVTPSLDDVRVEKKYSESIKLVDGKWEMKLPLIDDNVSLPNNYWYAARRLNCVSNMLKKSPEKYQFYCEKMADLKENHLELVTEDTVIFNPEQIWHIPHTITNQAKPRIVYDGPAEFQGLSLNKCLFTGPDNVQKLTDILVRFRENAVAYTMDLKNMFMSVQIAEEHRNLMRILWFKDDILGGEIETYRLKDLPYGLGCSMSMSTHALHETAAVNASGACEKAVEMTHTSYYVDDGLDSDETEGIAIKVVLDHIGLLETGGFKVHKICSNSKAVMEAVGRERWTPALQELVELNESQMPGHKVLGISWKPEEDVLAVIVHLEQKDLTKRGLWSMIAQVFDPIGLCSPFILTGRRILQKVCKAVQAWDQEIPEELRKMWSGWCAQLHLLERIKIPRCYTLNGRADVYELHTFADASNKGKGCVSYLRSLKNSKSHVAFVRGRAKVVPDDVSTTIPKLELQAAEMASQLHRKIKGTLRLPIKAAFLWSDSTTVLTWITSSNIRHKKYTARKIEVIRRNSGSDCWLYVGTDNNPADYASRGIPPKKADVNHPWIKGPKFLWERSCEWKDVLIEANKAEHEPPALGLNHATLVNDVSKCCSLHGDIQMATEPETASSIVNQVALSTEISKKRRMYPMPERLKRLVLMHSSLYDICKHIAIRWRYVSLLLSRVGLANEINGQLNVTEIEFALKQAVRVCQEDWLSFDILNAIHRLGFASAFKKADKNQLKVLNPIAGLDPFVDEDLILRVGGRLQHSELPLESIHQIILPKRHRLTELVIMKEHYASGHLGHNYVLAQVMKKYWVVHGICTTKHYLENCIYCKERRGKLAQQIMAPLPTCRSNKPKFCWQHCGIDLFGPMFVRIRRSDIKRYGLILTCMATRGVHLELLEDMSTSAFIQGLLRFLGRRGNKTEVLYSDCGSNFKGAHEEFKAIMKIVDQKRLMELGVSPFVDNDAELDGKFEHIDREKVNSVMARRNVDLKWNFNCPGASHQGGSWERLIKDTKRIMAALIMKGLEGIPALVRRKPSDFELCTILCEIESILNARPMTKISTNPNDWGILTPQAILTGCLDIMSPVDVFNKADQYRANWRYTQVVAIQFWQRWLTLYLPWLQVRSKWRKRKPNLKTDDIVMVLDIETEGRLTYPKARIVDTFPDKFGDVRNVLLQLPDGRRFKRSLNKIVPLECDAQADE